MKSIIYFTLGLSLILSVSCKKKQKEDEIKVEFNRSKLLSNFANNIIIVRYQSLNQSILDLETAFTYFKTTSDSANLVNLRLNYLDAYTKWQGCSSFEFGPAENNGLKTYLNTYPTDTNKIINNITTGGYNLATASNINATGFPALDYILYKKNNVYNTLNYYTNTPTAITYLENVINQAKTLISLVLNECRKLNE
jgi:predicted lipoprotein